MRVGVVLRRTGFGCDWRLYNLCGSHLRAILRLVIQFVFIVLVQGDDFVKVMSAIKWH